MAAPERRNKSKKRQAIYQALCARKDHPTAEMLFEAVKPLVPDLSLGTVYRSLNTFLQDGLAVSVGNVQGHERYDGNVQPHPHFVCRGCSRVIDLELQALPGELLESAAMGGCRVESYALSFFGTCPQCLGE